MHWLQYPRTISDHPRIARSATSLRWPRQRRCGHSVQLPSQDGQRPHTRAGGDLAAENQNIIGVKDTVDTISHTRKVIAAVRKVNPSFSVLSGFDEYYTVNRISGGNGVLCGLTNVEPETFVSLHHAWQSVITPRPSNRLNAFPI